MRGSTIFSLVLSIVLAAVAVFGVQNYLDNERMAIAASAGLSQRPQAPQNTIVVARQALHFGQPVRAEDLRLLDWPSNTIPNGAFRSIEDVVGDENEARYVMATMETDEPILVSKITGPGQRATLSATLGEGMKAVSIRVNDVAGVAGFVRPGDRVDVMLTRVLRNNTEGEQTYVDVLLQGVKVIAVDQTADDRSAMASVVRTVTFEVTTGEAQKLTLAANVGSLSLALRNVASANVEQTQPITLANLGGGPVASVLQQEREAERLRQFEDLLRNVGTELSDRIGTMEEKLNREPETIVVEKEVVVEREVLLDPIESASQAPDYVVIGVSRNAKREEYRVQPN